MQFPELSYANDTQTRLTQWLIRSIEALSGRNYYAGLYNTWRSDIVPAGIDVFCRMMDLINIRLDVQDSGRQLLDPQGNSDEPTHHIFRIGQCPLHRAANGDRPQCVAVRGRS